MKLLYNIALGLYELLLQVAALFSDKAKNWVAGRTIILQQQQRLQTDRATAKAWKLAWFHCASLGEFEQGRPVIEAFRQQYPSYKILLTFYSPSGYEVRKNYAAADYISYLPIDRSQAIRPFIEAAQPSVVFFVKYEFWPNLIQALHARQIPLYAFSAIFRSSQPYFKSYTGFFKQVLPSFTHIFVQNQASADLLQSVGYQNFTIAGDTRFDRVAQVAAVRKELPLIKEFVGDSPVLVVGSAWAEDVTLIYDFLQQPSMKQQVASLKIIIAPHEIKPEQLTTWQEASPLASVRYSELSASISTNNSPILWIDNIGMLSSIYAYADVAYIGGALGKGLHNTLEAATFGIPLFFGNKSYAKFKEAHDLIALGGAFAVASGQQMASVWEQMWPHRSQIGAAVETYVATNTGATAVIMAHLAPTLR